MSKILNIAWKDVRATFTDRNLLLIMLVTPLTLSTIIALALGDVTSGNSFQDIPVALVNLDQGDPATEVNYGDFYVSAFLPDAETDGDSPSCAIDSPADDNGAVSENNGLSAITEAVLYNDAEAARQAVRNGDVVAAVIIPPDFSEKLAYVPGRPPAEAVTIEVFGDPNRSISAGIIRSIVEGITNQILTGQIAIASTVDTLIASGNALNIDREVLACAFQPGFSAIRINREAIEADEFNPLVYIGSAQAAFFALFTAAGGASSILEERRNGTMQRMLVSPTPRSFILLGKLLGVFVMVFVQLTFLFFSFTVVASVLDGELTLIWGDNLPAIVALIVVLSLSAAGVGLINASLSKSPEQVNIVGGVIAMAMGVLGGAFFPVEVLGNLEFLTRLSIVRWGSDAFIKLSEGRSDIGTNLLSLLLIGSVLFIASLFFFNRRRDV